MELGYFTMPSHPPERPLKDGHEWDLRVIRWLDELGYKECWIGEHHTAPWEPHPSPDLLVAQALLQTKNIRLGPGGFLRLRRRRQSAEDVVPQLADLGLLGVVNSRDLLGRALQ